MKGIATAIGAAFSPGNAMTWREARDSVDAFPDPALMIDPAGNVVTANDDARFLADAFQRGDLHSLSMIVKQCIANRTPYSGTLSLAFNSEARNFHIIALCCAARKSGAPSLLILAKETTLENNLTKALIDSRQRFKDLVSCSSDFAWETDSDGTLCYVSHSDALGYPLSELNAMPASRFFHPDHPRPATSPFETAQPVEDMEVWLIGRNGDAVCMLISAVPVTDDQGHWVGARGICRDITQARELDAALAAAHNREHLLGEIASFMRGVLDPNEILPIAAETTAEAIGASYCRLWRLKNGRFETGATFAPSRHKTDEIFAAVAHRLDYARDGAEPLNAVFHHATDSHRYLIGLTSHHQKLNGAICLARGAKEPEWRPPEEELLAGVVDHLGIAIEQIEKHEELKRLSRTDHLTGLLNRHSFTDEAGKRLLHQKRTGEVAALLYIDLDNFKQINDQHGHQRGDDVLRVVGENLTAGNRVMDIAARFGGDEFVIWLENTDRDGATIKARHLLKSNRKLDRILGTEDHGLSMSIGIAVSDPKTPQTLDQLIDLADRAMYDAKTGGKANFKIAPAD